MSNYTNTATVSTLNTTYTDDADGNGISLYFPYPLIYLSIVAGFGAFLNFTVLIKSIQYERSLKTSSQMTRNSTNWLVISLTLSNIGTSTFTIPFKFIQLHVPNFPITERFCKYAQPLRELFLSVSIYSITFIAVGRYLILLKVFRKRSISSWIIKNLILWIACYLVFALPYSEIYTVVYDDDTPMCETQWSSVTAGKVNVTVVITINLFLPASLVLFSYIGIIRRLRRARMIVSPQISDKPQTSGENVEALANHSHHIVKVSLLLLAGFLITYIPYAVFIMALEYGYLETVEYVLMLYWITLCLLYSSVVVDSLILVYSSEVYRPKWLRSLCRCR